MASALAWLEPPELSPLTRAPAVDREVAGIWYDGLVGVTPLGVHAAADLLRWPEGRAGMLRDVLPPGSALAWTTALWVHTGRLLARRTDVVVAPDHRTEGRVVVHRQYLAPGDVAPVGGVPTTTPLRTAVDLLCFVCRPAAVAGTRALLRHGVSAEAVREVLGRPTRRLPARRALLLLGAAETPPGRQPS